MSNGNRDGNRSQWGVERPKQGSENSPQKEDHQARKGGWGRGPPEISVSAQSGRIRRDNRPTEMRGIKHALDMRMRKMNTQPRGWSDEGYESRKYVIGLPVNYNDQEPEVNWNEKTAMAMKIFNWEQVPDGANFNREDAGVCALFIDMTEEALCTLPEEIRETGTFLAPGESGRRGMYVVEPEEVCLEMTRRPQNWTVRLFGMPPEWGKAQATRNEMIEMMMNNIGKQAMESDLNINMETGKETDGESQYDACPERIWALFLRSNELKGDREVIHPLITPWISISEEGNKRYSHKDNDHLSDATKSEHAYTGMRVRAPSAMGSIIEAACRETADLMSSTYHREITSTTSIHTFPTKAYQILDGVVPPRNLYGEFDPNLIALRIVAVMPSMELGHPASVIKYLAERGLDPVVVKTRNTTIRCPGMKHVGVAITKAVVYGANRITTFEELMEEQPEKCQASIWAEDDTMQAVINRDFRKEEGNVVLSGVPSMAQAKRISIMDDIEERVQSRIEEAMKLGMERSAAFTSIQNAMGGYIDAQVGVVANTLQGKAREIRREEREYPQEREEEQKQHRRWEEEQRRPPPERSQIYTETDSSRTTTKSHMEKEDGGHRNETTRTLGDGGETPLPKSHKGESRHKNSETTVSPKGEFPVADRLGRQLSQKPCGQTQFNSGILNTRKQEEKCSQYPSMR